MSRPWRVEGDPRDGYVPSRTIGPAMPRGPFARCGEGQLHGPPRASCFQLSNSVGYGIHTLFTTPGTSCCFVNGRGHSHRLRRAKAIHRRPLSPLPAPKASAHHRSSVATLMPTFCETLPPGTFRRQQPRHTVFFELLSVSGHVRRPAPLGS
jgi:hypothetical protein